MYSRRPNWCFNSNLKKYILFATVESEKYLHMELCVATMPVAVSFFTSKHCQADVY